MQPGATLSDTTGCVLDPVFALRRTFTLAPGERIELLLWTQLADSREGALALHAQLQDAQAAPRLFAAAAAHAQAQRRQFGIDEQQAARFARWQDALLVSDPRQRAAPADRARGHGGAPALWGLSISGDRPIALLRVDGAAALEPLHDLLLAQRWWRALQFAVGAGGRGESSWLGWFVSPPSTRIAAEADRRHDGRVGKWRDSPRCAKRWNNRRRLGYRRGYYDDGTPLGSKDSEQCPSTHHRAIVERARRGEQTTAATVRRWTRSTAC
ncbi:hypothetical protein RLIN73S_07213 [Rhodanobacter lindaniclasticus]